MAKHLKPAARNSKPDSKRQVAGMSAKDGSRSTQQGPKQASPTRVQANSDRPLSVVRVTAAKIIENELRNALNNWESLVRDAADMMMTVDDRKGEIKFVNRDAWGCDQEALKGTLLADYVLKKDRPELQKCITSAFRSGPPATCELSIRQKDKEHWYSFSFGTVRRATATITIRDTTQQKVAADSLRVEQLRHFAASLDQVREEERTEVAREIHDELGQALAILKLDLAWLESKTKTSVDTRKKIKSMIRHVDQTIQHVRKIVTELRPSILDDMGLAAALEWQVSQFQERTGIRAIFDSSSEDIDLPGDRAVALFRVVQEALTNVMRHAEALTVRVALKSVGGTIRITITDDGHGLPPEKLNDKESFGLVGMRERIHRIGGEFNIFSGPGRGARLEITAPLK